MIRCIQKGEAIGLFKEQKNPLRYKYVVEALNSVIPQELDTQKIYIDSDENTFNLMMFYQTSYRGEGLWHEVYLVINDDSKTEYLINLLPKEGNLFICYNNSALLNDFKKISQVEYEGSRIMLHLNADTFKDKQIFPKSEKVVELTEEHDAFMKACESSRAYKYYSDLCMYKDSSGNLTDEFKSFGIIEDNRVISFCCVGSKTTDNFIPTREIGWIYTEEAYRRTGLGKAVLSKAVEYILKNGSIPYYSVVTENIQSIKTAKSVGFVENSKWHFCVVRRDKA